jgi:oxygen-independent coproporphyrinogen-3 oxidase
LIGNLRSIYIGGGTPFALSVTELERVLKPLDALVGVEYTVEAGRPDVFDKEKLELLKSHGVTRVCINPQTFSDKTLELIGRKHTVADVYKAFEMTDGMGFDVNVDLIAGLEGETVETFADGVRRAVETGAENITVHCLSLKSGAKLKEECSYIENDTISEMIKESREILTSAGYEPYCMYRQKYQAGNNENVGWSKKGKECTYNIDIMEETADNLALGSNAVSKRVFTEKNRIERFASPKDFKTYFEKIDEIMQKREKFFKKEL